MEINNNVFYVGVQDKDLRVFDVIMEAKHGTSYNAYLVKGTQKNALIETVKNEFCNEYIANIEKYVKITEIDYLIVNHTEPDHAGAVSRLLELNPNIVVCGTKMAIDFVRNIVNFDFKSEVLTANDSLELGNKQLKFFAFPMLHWPDSMYTYIKEDKILFTCDSFGVHYSSDKIFNDEVEPDGVLENSEIVEEYKYYFDNILGPFKNPFLLNALNKISLIPIDYICPGHGMIIRKDIDKYINMYKKWCEDDNKNKKKVTVCYVSSYGYTKKMAKAFVEGLKEYDIDVKEYDLQNDNIDEAKKDVTTSDGIIIGSPTILSEALPQVYEVMAPLNPILNKGMYAIAFGSYAWSGEAAMNISSVMSMLKFNMPFDPIRVKLNPSEYELDNIKQKAKEFAQIIINK